MMKLFTPETGRIYSYDVIRAVATLAVIIIHVSAEFVDVLPYTSAEFMIANIFDSAARIGVPLFIMLSGALMLDEKREINIKKAAKSALRIYVLLMLWSVFYAAIFYIIFPIFAPSILYWMPPSLDSFFKASLTGHYHFWYLYMIIGLYLITPVLRQIVKKENRQLVLYFLVLMVVTKSVLPLVNYFAEYCGKFGLAIITHTQRFDFSFLGDYLAYYILGWYLVNTDFTAKERRWISLIGCIGFLVTVFCTHLFSTETYKAYGFFYSYGYFNVMTASVAVFSILYHTFCGENHRKGSMIVYSFSQLSFGIYLIHPLVLFLGDKLFKEVLMVSDMFCFRMFADFFFTAIISFVVALIISQIPYLKRIIKA